MAGWGEYDTADSGDVFEGVFEEHEAHVGEVVVVLTETFLDVGFEFFVGDLVVESFGGNTVGEVAEDEVLGFVLVEVPGEVVFGETLFDDFEHVFAVYFEVFVVNETVAVGSFGLVDE